MLATQRLRQLLLDPADHPRGQAHLSSASALVLAGRKAYVVADDEHHIAQFDARAPAASPLRLLRIADGPLPADAAQRKARKPDLDALVRVPARGAAEQDLLVVWGSASRPQRERAFVLGLDGEGETSGAVRALSLASFCQPLREHFGALNLEAGAVQGDQLHLFQRAHRGQPLNGHVSFALDAVQAWLRGETAEAPRPLALASLELGRVDGVPLGITDAAVLPEGGWVLSAVAEDTADAYADGACVAAAVVLLDAALQVRRCTLLQGAPKVEGIAVAGPGRLWLVTDADDPGRPSELLEVLIA
jgi:hypothetical protein